jgi:Zn-dependent protease with chaperone function
MALTHEQFEALVRRLEVEARAAPGPYRVRVALLGALGYAYIFAVVALLFATLAGLVWVLLHVRSGTAGIAKLGFVVLALIGVLLRSLWVRLPAPEGLTLSRKEAPRLFEMIDALTTSLRAPRFHHILLDDQLNAAVVQVPRLGLFGWQQNYLLLGLPLMQLLTPDQFRAVVAHELGHLSGNHSRFAGWIYRLRLAWVRILEQLEEDRHIAVFVMERFFNWYAPYFAAYSFVLARADEFVADRCAAEAAGARPAAEGLMRLAVHGAFLGKTFLPDLYKRANEQPDPPAKMLTDLQRALREQVTPEEAATSLQEALARPTDYNDTHPSLRDRLQGLCYEAPAGETLDEATLAVLLPGAAEETAARRFLGEAEARLMAHLESDWRERTAPGWRQRFEYARGARAKLAALNEKAGREPLTEEEAWDRARWTAEFESEAAALPLLRDLVAAHPRNVGAQFTLGRLLLEQGDDTGIPHVERAMDLDPTVVVPGLMLVNGFLEEQGRKEEAARFREQAESRFQQLSQAQQERSETKPGDTFAPHGLPDAEVEHLRAQLAGNEAVAAAYLVRKVVAHFPDRPFYVLGVTPHVNKLKLYATDPGEQLVAELSQNLSFPGDVTIVPTTGQFRKLGKALRSVAGSEIYRR